MAIAGRSYANVPVIIRGSLEDPDDFIAKVTHVVTSQPSQAQTATRRATILRSTLADPPVLTTAAPVVVAAAADRRRFAGAAIQVLANPYAPPVITVATPGPVVVTSQPPVLPAVPAFITRNTLADPPVLATPGPVVVAPPADRRWFAAAPLLALSAPQAPPPPPAAATPPPLVVTSQPPRPRTVQALIVRNTRQDPPALTTGAPVVTSAPADRRWFTVRPATVITGAPASAVTVAGTWTGSYAVSSGFFFPFPAAKPMQVPIANTAGDWVFAVIAWRPSTLDSGVSVTIADDAHNWWEPLGAPAADSDAPGVVRTAVWAAPAARVANTDTGITIVQVAPTGPVLSMAVTIIDFSGILPWYVVAIITGNFGNAVSSLSLSAAAPSAQAIAFAAFASDNNADTITGPSGWTALTGASATNGVDHTADITLTPAWKLVTGSSTASVSSAGSQDLAGVIAGVLVSAPQPAQSNPNWPVMITEVAIGSGAGTPPSEMTWTPLSGRSLAFTVQQGKQYSLGQLQAGEGTLLLDDPDGALIPPGTGSYAGIDSGTPVRRRVIWPPSPTPNYVAFSGFVRRWPWNMDENQLRGQVQATLADVWAYGPGTLNAMAIQEALLDSPHSLWPLTDPPGSTGAGNLVPNGAPLPLVTSKFGDGGASVTWGANSGALAGMSSAQVTSSGAPGGASGMFSQDLGTGTALSTPGQGFALAASDPAYPPISGGVTLEAWAQPQLGGETGFTVGTGTPATFGSTDSFPAGQALVATVAAGFTFPTGITPGNAYFVIGSGSSYELSTVAGGGGLAISVAGAGFFTPTVPWNPVILAARGIHGTVAQLEVNHLTGALLLRYRPATATIDTLVTVDSAHDYRNGGLCQFSLSITQTTWRVLVNVGSVASASGTFSAPLPPTFSTFTSCGVMDRVSQGLGWTGNLAMCGVYPGISPPIRVLSRFEATAPALVNEAAPDRVERILEYGGLTGRRWIGRELGEVTFENLENDLVVSGQDIGGQAAVSSVNNIVASTFPALAYVAPTGDIVYRSKFYVWNEPVRWVLGDNTAGGEIPFLPGGVATDYDPSRVTAQVQLTQLDTQAVTTPSGVMSATNMAAVAATAQDQYGGQPYQVSGYLTEDWSASYSGGASLVDLANWVQNIYARPANRIQSVTVDAARHPAAWPFWAGASVGDMVQVNVRLPTASTSPLIALTARITQTARSSQFSQDSTAATIAATLDFSPEYNALTCDDPVRGLLNGTNCLPW
jgi:hypothetical protein